MRLDKRIADQFGLSRRGAMEAIRRGQVDVAGQTCLEPGSDVDDGVPVSCDLNRMRLEGAKGRLRVLYEDSHVLVVDKPSGVLTQPTPERERDTLLERAGRYLTRKRGVARPYVGIVHRIDRDTSGVVLLVCAPKALRPFQSLFRDHAIERSYVAIVEGAIEPPRGTIDRRLVADRGDGRRGSSRRPDLGVKAITHYEQIAAFGGTASQLCCRLETGRTHQIRIHLADVGHPVIGETIYRARKTPPFPIPFHRQALHARMLGFVHPITGQSISVEAPLPDDLAGLIRVLRERHGGASLT